MMECHHIYKIKEIGPNPLEESVLTAIRIKTLTSRFFFYNTFMCNTNRILSELNSIENMEVINGIKRNKIS